MTRRKPRTEVEGELRAYLLAEARYFRDEYGRDPITWEELSKPVEQLETGQPYVLRRYELPDDHDQRGQGAIYDRLVLDSSDVLRPE